MNATQWNAFFRSHKLLNGWISLVFIHCVHTLSRGCCAVCSATGWQKTDTSHDNDFLLMNACWHFVKAHLRPCKWYVILICLRFRLIVWVWVQVRWDDFPSMLHCETFSDWCGAYFNYYARFISSFSLLFEYIFYGMFFAQSLTIPIGREWCTNARPPYSCILMTTPRSRLVFEKGVYSRDCVCYAKWNANHLFALNNLKHHHQHETVLGVFTISKPELCICCASEWIGWYNVVARDKLIARAAKMIIIWRNTTKSFAAIIQYVCVCSCVRSCVDETACKLKMENPVVPDSMENFNLFSRN